MAAWVRFCGALLLGFVAVPAMAADLGPIEAPVAPVVSDWRFGATFYGWASGISGDVGVLGLGPAPVDVKPDEALRDLKGALMASFGAVSQDWMLLGDVMWARLGDNGRIGDSILGYDATLNQVMVQGLVGYRLPIKLDRLDLRGTVGFRYVYLDADVSIGPVFSPLGVDVGGQEQWIDPTVGLYAKYDFTDRWFATLIGDVGGFDVGSKLTWQAYGAIGYNWTKTISTVIGYRAIYEDYEHGGFVYDTTQQGVLVGLGIHW